MPLSTTLDVVGPLARTVSDVALLTAILAAPADDELTTAAHPEILDALTTDLPKYSPWCSARDSWLKGLIRRSSVRCNAAIDVSKSAGD